MSSGISQAIQLLYEFTLQGHYTDQDEFGEILGWYLQARFGDANTASADFILQSSTLPAALSSPASSSQSSPASSFDELTSGLPPGLESSTSGGVDMDGDAPTSVLSRKMAINQHVKTVMRLPDSVQVPIEALEYWHKYRGTSQVTALSLFVAGVHRKAHDVDDV